MFRRRNVPSINSVYEAISQPHLLQTTIQFIFKYQTSFSRLFLAWWSSDDIAASDWSDWPQGALWLAADYWPSWSLMSALSAPEDVTWSRSAPIGNIDMSRHKNRTGAILREMEHPAHVSDMNMMTWAGVRCGDKFYEENTTMASTQPTTLTSSKNHLLIVAKLCWIFIIS